MTAEAAATAVESIPGCPYQGLEPFSEADRSYFFGRDVDTQRIGANLVTSPLTIFYGASGVGKTSVLLAGVLPFVHEQPDVTAIVFRKWQGSDFERELKSEIASAVAAKSDPALNVDQTLDRVLDEAARLTGGTIAVVFDQFEEYMLYHPATSEQGRSFDTAFARAVNRTDIDVNFLIGIREDALARLDRFRQYIPDLLGNRQHLVHLDAARAEEAIRGPLQHYDEVVRAQGRPELAMTIEDGLVGELIDQVRIGGVSFGGTGRIDAETAVRVETPFLQMVLLKLWEAERNARSGVMRRSTLQGLGNAKKIVLDHVEGVMRSVTEAERAAATTIFDRLVTPSRSKIAYGISDLEVFAGSLAEAVPSLVQKLSDQHVRILRAVASADGQVRYEIFHDVLSEAVLAWRAKHLRDLQEVEAKRRRKGCIVMAVIVLAIIGAIAWYLHQKSEERQELERRALDAQAKLLQVLSDRASTQVSPGKVGSELALLETALAGYRELGDRAGEARILGQIASLKAGKQDYEGATKAYSDAIAVAPENRSTDELRARLAVVMGDSSAQQGDHKKAAGSYLTAAELFRKTGDTAQQAQVFTSAAVAYQNAGDLETAEKIWNSALQIQKRLKDSEGLSRTLAGLETIEKQRRLREVTLTVTDTAPPTTVPAPVACTFDSMNGYWAEVAATRGQARGGRSVNEEFMLRQSAAKFIWQFSVVRGKAGDMSMEVARLDGSVNGSFAFVEAEGSFAGTLEWVNGEIRKNVVFEMPSEQQGCGRVVTNQSFYFVRTKAPPAAAY
jgi:tetratricopeptide (TPR) repeat protein